MDRAARVIGPPGVADEHFGLRVEINSDGTSILVSAYSKKIGANSNQGSVLSFTRSGSTWTFEQELTATDAAGGDVFGTGIALSSDGNMAVIGANGKKVGSNILQGAAYIFKRSNNSWVQDQKLLASDGAASDAFGNMVALSGDKNIIMIGAVSKKIGNNISQGAAYIYYFDGTNWVEQRLLASDGRTQDQFGYMVALNYNGNTAIVSALSPNNGNNNSGEVYSFDRSGNSWTQDQILLPTDIMVFGIFGTWLRLSDDGNTALIANSNSTVGENTGQGSAYIFTRINGSWSQQQQLVSSNGAAGDHFGSSIGLSADDRTAIVGAYQKNFGTNIKQGAAYIFTLVKSGSISLTSDPNPSSFGQSVTFTATLSPISPDTTEPTGTVTFLDGTTSLDTVPVSDGKATLNTSNLSVGTHSITAQYGDDPYLDVGTPFTVTQIVTSASCDLLVIDRSDDDSYCGTLRAALNQANTLLPSQNVTITVSTPVITLTAALPSIINTGSNNLTIEAGCTTGENGKGLPQTQLVADSSYSGAGLTLPGKVSVKGFKVIGFSGYGVEINGSNNKISCSWVGTADGLTASPNTAGGIHITGSNNSLGGSSSKDGLLISGNTGPGLKLDSGINNTLSGVWLGYRSEGTSTLRNEGGALKMTLGTQLKFNAGNKIHS